MVANALVIRCALASKEPAQPTQKSISGFSPDAAKSAIVLTGIENF
jgi:hypothetical protein